MIIGLLLKRCRPAHFIRHLHFRLTIVEHQLQETHTVEQNDRKIPFAKRVREELSDQTSFHHRRMDAEKPSENLANSLSSRLGDHQVLPFQELIFFQCRPPPQILDLHALHGSLYG